MAKRYEICLSGSGGQGLILAGIILAEAAGVYEGKHVAQSQSYGPEARGGASKAEVIISDGEIDYPMATRLDLLLAMNQKSSDSFYFDLKPEGTLVVDLIDAKQKQMIWQGTARAIVSKNQQTNSENIDTAITEMFNKMPNP